MGSRTSLAYDQSVPYEITRDLAVACDSRGFDAVAAIFKPLAPIHDFVTESPEEFTLAPANRMLIAHRVTTSCLILTAVGLAFVSMVMAMSVLLLIYGQELGAWRPVFIGVSTAAAGFAAEAAAGVIWLRRRYATIVGIQNAKVLLPSKAA